MICTLLKFYFCFAFPLSLSVSLHLCVRQAAVSFSLEDQRHHFLRAKQAAKR